MNPLSGIHHVTSIASDAQQNVDFYAGLLGLRLVKKTVNFDDPGSYHLYYGDRAGSPGSIITFFVWPGATRGTRGAGEPVAQALRVRPGSLPFWRERLEKAGLPFTEARSAWNEMALAVADPDGLVVEIVETAQRLRDVQYWPESGIPEQFAVEGLHGVKLAHQTLNQSVDLFTAGLGFTGAAAADGQLRFEVGSQVVDVLRATEGVRGRQGAGTIHHVAFRVPDAANQLAWQQHAMNLGLHVSPVMDRNYFQSIYFREPGGVLFEVATDGPGFAVDEPEAELGHTLKLPAWYESLRGQIEKHLPRIVAPQGIRPATAQAAG